MLRNMYYLQCLALWGSFEVLRHVCKASFKWCEVLVIYSVWRFEVALRFGRTSWQQSSKAAKCWLFTMFGALKFIRGFEACLQSKFQMVRSIGYLQCLALWGCFQVWTHILTAILKGCEVLVIYNVWRFEIHLRFWGTPSKPNSNVVKWLLLAMFALTPWSYALCDCVLKP